MNLKSLLLIAGAFYCLIPSVQAGPRASVSYSVKTDTIDSAGRRAASTSYSNDGSLGGVVGISTVAAPAETAKHGYLGQLYDTIGLQLAVSPASVNEGSTGQLSGALLLDDLTTLPVPADSITWSIQNGPLTNIGTWGQVTAATVYQNTTANVQGLHAGYTGSLALTVLNVNNDDLPGYSSDGIDDSWQAQYFGLNNPNASPLLDPDGDGQHNLFEFTAGLSPISRTSRFIINAQMPAQAGQMKIVISPRLPGRTYTVRTTPTLGPSAIWTDLTGSTTSDNGSVRTITDTSATGARKFYKVEITQP